MKKNAVETDRRRVKKLVEGKNFDFLIMSLICMDAVILGLMTSDAMNRFFEGGLFILDRLFMAIFIIEMIMKILLSAKSSSNRVGTCSTLRSLRFLRYRLPAGLSFSERFVCFACCVMSTSLRALSR